MTRQSLHAGLALVVAMTLLAAGCGAGGGKAGGGSEPVVLTLASRPGDIQWTPGVADFVKRVGQLSGGALRIKVASLWGGDGNADAEQRIVRDVANGKADLGWVGTRVFDTLGVNSFQALTAPMLIDSYPLLRAVIASDIPGQMLGGLVGLGVTGLAVVGDSLQKPIGARRPLLGRSDWSDIAFATLRSIGEAEAIRALGARNTDLWGDPLLRAFESGTVQGRDLGMFAYVAANLETVPYLTANVSLWPGTLVLMANPHLLSTLSEQQRGWLQRAATEAAAGSTDLVDQDASNVTTACGGGARLADATETDLAWLRQSFAPVYAHLEQDPHTKSFIESIQTLKNSTPGGPALDIPDSCIGPRPHGTTDDPLEGTGQTGQIAEAEFVQAFVAGGGSEREGHQAFTAGASRYLTVTLQFQDGVFKEFESDDGSSPQQGYNATYLIGPDDTLTMSGCPPPQVSQVYRFEAGGDTLRLYMVTPCTNGDAPYNVALFATFPMTKTG
jgi:TRAP-type C4-dicarboxylate transport system substrate-binding protein